MSPVTNTLYIPTRPTIQINSPQKKTTKPTWKLHSPYVTITTTSVCRRSAPKTTVKIGTGSCRVWKQSTTTEIGTRNSHLYGFIYPTKIYRLLFMTEISTSRHHNDPNQEKTLLCIKIQSTSSVPFSAHFSWDLYKCKGNYTSGSKKGLQKNQYSSRNPSHTRPTTIPITENNVEVIKRLAKLFIWVLPFPNNLFEHRIKVFSIGENTDPTLLDSSEPELQKQQQAPQELSFFLLKKLLDLHKQERILTVHIMQT